MGVLKKSDWGTVVVALRYGIAHAQGTASEEGDVPEARQRAQKAVNAMQELHQRLTGKRFIS